MPVSEKNPSAKKPLLSVLGVSLLSAVVIAPLAHASGNSLSNKEISMANFHEEGQKDGEGKCGEGKCGDMDEKGEKIDKDGKGDKAAKKPSK